MIQFCALYGAFTATSIAFLVSFFSNVAAAAVGRLADAEIYPCLVYRITCGPKQRDLTAINRLMHLSLPTVLAKLQPIPDLANPRLLSIWLAARCRLLAACCCCSQLACLWHPQGLALPTGERGMEEHELCCAHCAAEAQLLNSCTLLHRTACIVPP